jgi:multicomponent Na+:H+ antiporter subunit G
MTNIFALIFMAGGVLFMLLAAVGMLRMPDTYLRSHTATLAPTLGKMGILIAVAFAFGSVAVTAKAILILVFLFVTAPVAAHLILRAAYHDRSPLSPLTRVDDYAKHQLAQKSPSSPEGD